MFLLLCSIFILAQLQSCVFSQDFLLFATFSCHVALKNWMTMYYVVVWNPWHIVYMLHKVERLCEYVSVFSVIARLVPTVHLLQIKSEKLRTCFCCTTRYFQEAVKLFIPTFQFGETWNKSREVIGSSNFDKLCLVVLLYCDKTVPTFNLIRAAFRQKLRRSEFSFS